MKDQGNVIPIDRATASESEVQESRSALDEIVREGARRLLHQAIEAEVAEYIERHQHLLDAEAHRLVVRNGYMPERTILTGAGPLPVRQPRVHDRRENQAFSSAIIQKYARRSTSISTLLPTLYLRGISTGQLGPALEELLGEGAPSLSSQTITRLSSQWQQEYKEFTERDLSATNYVYLWADGIYFNVRLSDDRPCLLVLIGGTADGRKEIVAIADGERESKLSWQEILLDLKRRGLRHAPKIAIADGALGFWSALEEVFPSTRQQRCWVHKTSNILNKMPKKLQPVARQQIQLIYHMPTKADALNEVQSFMRLYQSKYPAACQCLERDLDVLLTFYDFPKEHWRHLRTTNVIESAFATVRHRTRQTKGNGSRAATLAMAYKLLTQAQKKWQRLDGQMLIKSVAAGVRFVDGLPVSEQLLKQAA